jgi:hypothetical protein
MLRRIIRGNRNFRSLTFNDTAIVVVNGPSLNKNLKSLYSKIDSADVYCVNYMALNEIFINLKPRFYVLADPIFWREDANADFKRDNELLFSRLQKVNWEMDVICPAEGITQIKNHLSPNSNINVLAMANIGMNFKSDRLTLMSFKIGIATPIFINVLIPALWHALVTKKKIIDIYGADFTSFQEYYVDQKTNELHASYSHFYKNTTAQDKAGEKYAGVAKKMLHERLYQNWLSFKQIYLISIYAKQQKVKIRNCSTSSFIDCFERE